MEKRKQFTFYWSFYDALAELPREQAQQALWNIVTYALLGELPETEMEPSVAMAFKLISPVLDSSRKKAKGAVRSRAASKQSKDTGRKAGGFLEDSSREGEKEEEKEVEKEYEMEIENEIENEKESLLHTGSGPEACVREQFEEFWEAYPVKLGKQRAFRVWQRELPDIDRVITGLSCWKRSRNWRAEDGRYIPRADRFLDEKHYLEIPKGTVPMGATGHLGKAELEAIERLMNEPY